MTRERLFTAFFFVGLLFLLYQLSLFLAPFSTPLILAAIVAVCLSPLTARLAAALRSSRSAAAIVLTLATTVVVLVPMVFLIALMADEATST